MLFEAGVCALWTASDQVLVELRKAAATELFDFLTPEMINSTWKLKSQQRVISG